MTRIDSTSTPSSQTARAKRSTSTFVLPVPAPAETKTSPRASTARCCSGLSFTHASRGTSTRARTRWAVAALGVVFDVALAHSVDDVDGEVAGALDLAPESLFVEVVVLRESGDAVVLRLGAEQAARLPLAGERPVETAERLDPDEIPQHEHVERDLELLLLLDLHGRMGVLARLVVLDDAARAERIDVDSVDLSRERHAWSQLEPTLQLGRRPLGAEQHF